MSKLAKLAIIGLGNMGEALLAGLINNEIVDADNVIGVEARTDRANEIADRFGIAVTDDAGKACAEAGIVLLAVKPKDAGDALARMKGGERKLLISVCAGLDVEWLSQNAGENNAVVRVMPNTPALVGQGAGVYCPGPTASAADCIVVETLLGAVGQVYRVDDENLMDAVTGLSGSGPAFVFLFLEAMADGGVACGLPRELARDLAAQTVLGAATMAVNGVAHTAELKDRVCSPAGTTIEGVRTLETMGFRSAVLEAVASAAARSRELGG